MRKGLPILRGGRRANLFLSRPGVDEGEEGELPARIEDAVRRPPEPDDTIEISYNIGEDEDVLTIDKLYRLKERLIRSAIKGDYYVICPVCRDILDADLYGEHFNEKHGPRGPSPAAQGTGT